MGTYWEWLPLPSTVTRIAFGSCAFQWDQQSIWDAVIAAEPDLFLYLGDVIYGDFDGERAYAVTEETLNREWGRLAEVESFRRLASTTPVLATWDNHDYGHHSAGAEFPLKEVSKEIFLAFFGEPAGSPVRTRAGIYQAHVFGPEGKRVQVILLDTRTFKGLPLLAEWPEGAGGSLGKYAPQTDTTVTLLGAEQWAWLEERLKEPAELRLIASSGQIVADQKGMDEWGNYPHERRRLFDLIESTGADGVLFLSGNVHFAEISATDEGPYVLGDFTSSGLTHVSTVYPEADNPYRIGEPYVDLNFGLVEIDWEAEFGPTVTLKAVDLDGTSVLRHQVELSILQREPQGR
jgi:alkaline phosphatase D